MPKAEIRKRNEIKTLLQQLLLCRTYQEVQALAPAFVELGCRFRPIDDCPGNESQITITTDMPRSTIERVQNGLGGVLEHRGERARRDGEGLPESPRQAVQRWFNVPDGYLENVVEPDAFDRLGRHGFVAYSDGPERRFSNFHCRDYGIGIRPRDMSNTILSLHRGNKIDKWYTIGMYGHGGSTAFRGSPNATLIASRFRTEFLDGAEDFVAVTFVRFSEPAIRDGKIVEKLGAYEYLVGPDGEVLTLPADEAEEWDIAEITRALMRVEKDTKIGSQWDPIVENLNTKCPFAEGTLVLHFAYDLGLYHKSICTAGRSVRLFLNAALFDPILPLPIYDLRSMVPKKNPKKKPLDENGYEMEDEAEEYDQIFLKTNSRRIRWLEGLRRQLNRDVGGTIAHSGQFEVQFISLASGRPQTEYVDVEYWVKNVDSDVRNVLPENWNVLFTHGCGGQVICFESSRFFNDPGNHLRLSSLKKSLIIHVNLDRLTQTASRALTSSTRDSLVSSPTKDAMYRAIKKYLAGIQALTDLNDARQRDHVRKAGGENTLDQGVFHKMLRAAGMPPIDLRETTVDRDTTPEPIAIRPDGPSFLKCENRTPIVARPGGTVSINLAADIPNKDDLSIVVIASPDPQIIFTPKSRERFKQGRATISVRFHPNAKPGSTGSLSVTLYGKHNVVQTNVPYKLSEPNKTDNLGKQTKRVVHGILEPVCTPVYRENWPEGWKDTTIGTIAVGTTRTDILINVDNVRLQSALIRAKYPQDTVDLLKAEFVYHIGVNICGLYTRTGDVEMSQEVLDAAVDMWIAMRVRRNLEHED